MEDRSPKYKDTGVDWLGKIPEGWKNIRFRFLAKTKKGGTAKDKRKCEAPVPYLGMEYLRGQSGAEMCCPKSNSIFADENDLLILWDGSKAGEFIRAKKGVVGSTLAKVKNLGKLEDDFLYYVVKIFETKLRELTIGMGIPHVNSWFLKDVWFPVPSKQEQKRIADFLDDKTDKISTLIQKNNQRIEKLKEYKQSLISRVVTNGLDPNARMKDSGVDWLGRIPKEWDLEKFKYISNPLPKSKFKASDGKDEGEYPFFTSSEDQTKFINEYFYDDKALILGTGGSANIHYYNGRFSSTGDTYVLRPKEEAVKGRYIFYYLKSIIDVIDHLAFQGVGLEHLQKEFLNNLLCPIPPKECQRKIVNYLDREVGGLDKAIKKLQNKNKLLKEYKKSLISDVVTGKIKVT